MYRPNRGLYEGPPVPRVAQPAHGDPVSKGGQRQDLPGEVAEPDELGLCRAFGLQQQRQCGRTGYRTIYATAASASRKLFAH